MNLEKEKMFEEIERLDNLLHSSDEFVIKNKALRSALEDKHVCMCGHLIFHSFLPNEIQKEYLDWHHKKAVDEVTLIGVKAITDDVNKKIIERLKIIDEERLDKLAENEKLWYQYDNEDSNHTIDGNAYADGFKDGYKKAKEELK